jgi:GxxExxY protein
MNENEISRIVLDSAMRVHSSLGAGLLEETYKICLQSELVKRGIKVSSEVPQPVTYNGQILKTGFRIDLLVEEKVIVELKSVASLAPIHKAQLLTYLKLSKLHLGLLLNFNTVHLKDGIVRVINSKIFERRGR